MIERRAEAWVLGLKKTKEGGKTYIGSSPSPTKMVDTPASMTEPRHKPSLIPMRNANRIMTLISSVYCPHPRVREGAYGVY